MGENDAERGTAVSGELAEEADLRLAYFLLRCSIGTAMLMHGIARVFVIGAVAFANGMVRQMSHAPLPPPLVRLFGVALPFGELAIGLLLVLGLRTRWTLAAGVALMLALIFGSGLNSDWQGVGIQLTYAAIFCALLALRRHNVFSVDGWLSVHQRRATAGF